MNITFKDEERENKQYKKMTETPVSRLIISLSIPTIITMLVTNIYNLADTAFVGTLGNSASGAIGVVFGFMALLQAIGFMFGQGSGSRIARRLGEKNIKEAGRIASMSIFFSIAISLVVEILCLFSLDSLVMLLGSTETIAPFAKTYVFYIILAAPFVVASFNMNNILRYEGKAFLGMIGMMTGGILNIFGDYILIINLKMGIAGAGISTAVSQVISFCILLSMFLTNKSQCHLSFKSIWPIERELWDIMSTGFPSMLRQGLNSLATILLNMEASVYGDAAVAAMSIVARIVFFTFSIALGIGQGFQPVSAFNYGAKKYKRLKDAYKFTSVLSFSVLAVLSLIVLFFSSSLIQIFRNDPEVIEIGTRALRLQSAAQIILPLCMSSEMLMQSTGKKLPASILSSTRSGLFFIPALLILSRIRGLSGIQEAQSVAFILSIIPALLFAADFFKKLPKEDG